MDKITGKNNNLIKDTKKLLSSSKERRESGAFVLEGARLCFDVLNSFCNVELLLVTQACLEKYGNKIEELQKRANQSFIITDEIAARLGDTQNAQGIFCVCSIPQDEPVIGQGKYIALDCVQDPSNLGAIIRSAEALGIDGVILYNCCDLYNSKALRSSMGSILRMPVTITGDLEDTLISCKNDGFFIYGTVIDSKAQRITETDFTKSTICVIGNEANGISDNIKSVCSCFITIPMKGRAESMNASAAAAITMWEMMR